MFVVDHRVITLMPILMISWHELQRTMHAAGTSTARIEACRVGTGYDEGGGQSLEGWLDEIEEDLQ